LVKTIVIIGPAYPLRGGLSTFNERLAKEFQDQGWKVILYTFSLQYPGFLFPGKTQYSTEGPPENLDIRVRINSVNPLNWWKVGREIKKLAPELLVVRYWLPFMGPSLGTLLRIIKRGSRTRVVAITDNIIPHEKRPGDILFTKYFLPSCDAYVTMSEKVMRDLQHFAPSKPAKQVPHPLYDNFGAPVGKNESRAKLGIQNEGYIILFFGFIRKYKGLDLLLEAVKILKEKKWNPMDAGWKVMIAGEYYEDAGPYNQLIQQEGIRDCLILRTDFIPNTQVKYYFGAADVVIQPYRNATQSGVTPLAYHFEKPMIVTRVGALPDYVPDGKAGLVTDPDPEAIASSLERYFELGEAYFLPQLREEKKKYSWSTLYETILELAGNL
jgi:glycosyltransferase involved in cell wall biosynthesis